MKKLTIGQLAKKANVNLETIPYYERRGLMPKPPRNKSGHREYSQEAVKRTEFIKRCQALGFSLMESKRKVEIFSAGCPVCDDAVEMVKQISCQDCEIHVLDMGDPSVANRAKGLSIRSVPAILIDGELADCCAGRGPNEVSLKNAGLGQSEHDS